MINVALGVGLAVVPFVLSKVFGGSSSSSSGGWFRTHTTGPTPATPSVPSLSSTDPPMFTEEQIFGPPRLPVKPTPAPSEEQAIAKAPPSPAPQPMPTPPPMNELPSRQQVDDPYRAPEQLPVSPPPVSTRPWDGPGQTQLPTAQDIAALPAPPAPPTPPPFPGDAPSARPTVSVTPSVTEERPPQERGELPAELQALPASTADTPPTGYDPVKAKSLAKQIASNITNRGNNYSRDLLRQFQRFAGITTDGIYGGESRGALEFFGVRRPPIALFKPTATQPYRWASWSQ